MSKSHALPVRVYQTDCRVNVAAAMPGLEPTDITISVSGDRGRVHGRLRGPHQDECDLTVREWTIGTYDREIRLPMPVDGSLTNATYSNGVLVVNMPKVQRGRSAVPADIRLVPLESTRGEHVGHVGRTVCPATTAEHLRQHQHVRAGAAAGARPAA